MLPKAAVQSYSPKSATLQTYTPQRLPKASLQCDSRKLLPKVAAESCSPKLRSQRCSTNLKFFQAAVQSCSAKLLPKAAPESCSPALLHKIVPNAVLQSCCPKAAESCSPKLLPKIAPQSCVLIATPQRCSPKLRFFKAAVQSSSSKLLPTAVPCAAPQNCAQRCSPTLLHQSCGKLPPKVAAENCSPKLRPNSYSKKVLTKAAVLQSCRAKLLLKAAH